MPNDVKFGFRAGDKVTWTRTYHHSAYTAKVDAVVLSTVSGYVLIRYYKSDGRPVYAHVKPETLVPRQAR